MGNTLIQHLSKEGAEILLALVLYSCEDCAGCKILVCPSRLRGNDFMRTVCRYLALGGVVLLLAAVPISARKIKIESDYDKSNDFARYKRYTTGKNYLVTHQRPEVRARIDKVLVESLHGHLQAKGFVLDENHPDFIITYEAGSLSEADISPQPQTANEQLLNPIFGLSGPDGVPSIAWTYALAKLKLSVTDVDSGKVVWTALASEKVEYPRKVLKDLKKKVDVLMTRTLKSFPPPSVPK